MEITGMLKRTQLPDYVELRVDADGKEEITWVVERSVNRSLPSNLRAMLDMIDRGASHKVVVRTGSQDLTLSQFDKMGVPLKSLVMAQSTMYNLQSEVKRIERTLDNLPNDHPQRAEFVSRLEQLKKRLGINDDPVATEKSDEALRKLEQIFAQEAFDQTLKIPDEELETYDLTKLASLGVPKLTKQWDALVMRWARLKQQQKGDNNANNNVQTPDQTHPPTEG
jgi:hypothetical protein